MRRMMATAILLWAAFCGASTAQAPMSEFQGFWRGQARLNEDATPALVEFVSCPEGVCAILSLPEIGYAHLPLGPVEEAQGRFRAGNLAFSRDAAEITGVLSAHGPAMLDAMGHGANEAEIRLARAAAPRREFREDEIAFANGSVELNGTLVRPRRGAGPFPGIVAVLGSGPAQRWASLARARDWARLGYAVLIYDKRSNWTSSSLDDLADDAAAAYRTLASRSDVRADRVGFWAHSQGGWVAPRAMIRGANAAFLIAVSGGGVTPRQVETYDYGATLDHLRVQGGERARAEALVQRYFDYLNGDIDFDAMTTSLADAREAPWYRPLGLSRVLPTQDVQPQWRWVASYDPGEDLSAITAPTLVMLAGDDRPSLLPDAVARWTRALGRREGMRVSVFPGADHHMRRSARGWRRVDTGYEAELSRFLVDQRDR